MNKWQKASSHILVVEGGLVDHKSDPGGITKYGISLRFLRGEGLDLDGDGDVDADDVRGLSTVGAIALYERFFWEPYFYDTLPDGMAVKMFDMTVNMGPAQSHKLVQKALWGYGLRPEVDGKLGPKTRQAILDVCAQPGGEVGLLASTRTAQRCFYEGLVMQKPALGAFTNGWLNRTYLC